MSQPSALRRRLPGDDDGFALLTVLGSMVIITTFLLSTLAYALNNSQPSRNDQDAKAALAAAQAGIEEYISRLNANDTYFDNNGTDPSNAAFSAAGVVIPGTGGQAARFRYQQLTTATDIGLFGVIRLKVTGTSGTQSRDLTAEITPDGFLKYIYFTDLESADPRMWRSGVHAKKGTTTLTDDASGSVTGNPNRPYIRVNGPGGNYTIYTWVAQPEKYDELCGQYWHAGRNKPVYTVGKYYEYAKPYDSDGKLKGPPNQPPTELNASTTAPISFSCREVQFGTGDEINGPLHSNDSLQVAGSVLFKGKTTSAWDTGSATNTATPHPSGLWWGSSVPNATGKMPEFGPKISLPVSNTQLVARAQPMTPDSPDRGCLYTGDTRITFVGSQMKVLSPMTTTSVPRCYNTATPTTEQTVAIPPVIYVQDATTGTCSLGAVGYPKTLEGEVWGSVFTTKYDCKKGNAFVSGSLSGRVTVATSNDIVVVGDTTYANDVVGTDAIEGSDALGLIPTEYAWVYHPVKADGSNLLGTPVRKIDAAILSVKRSFLAQNYYQGAMLSTNNNVDDGTKLKVRGAIAQKHRGPVGTPGGGSFLPAGYIKLYTFDKRLEYSPPPFFLRPDDAPWRVTKVTD